MQYVRIISHAWQVTWRNRSLWFFGVLAALFGVNLSRTYGLGGWNIDPKRFLFPGPPQAYPTSLLQPSLLHPAFYEQTRFGLAFIGLPNLGFAPAIALAGVALLLIVISLLVRYTSSGALIGQVDDIEQRDHTTVSVGLHTGWHYLPRLLAIDILIGMSLLILALAILVMIALFAGIGILPWRLLTQPNMGPNAGPVGGLWGVFVALILGVIVMVVIVAAAAFTGMVRQMAQREAVLENRGVWLSLNNAVRLVGRKLGQIGLLWLLLFSINLAIGLVTLPLTIFGGIAVSIPFELFTRTTHPSLPGLLVSIPLLLVIALAGLFLNGIYLAFRSAVWTLAYREVAEPLAET